MPMYRLMLGPISRPCGLGTHGPVNNGGPDFPDQAELAFQVVSDGHGIVEARADDRGSDMVGEALGNGSNLLQPGLDIIGGQVVQRQSCAIMGLHR